MKKIITLLLTITMVMGLVLPVAQADNTQITVTINNQQIQFDQPPVIIDGRTLVPLRAIFEGLGATVDWNGDTQTVTAKKENTTVKITIGDNKLYVNGNTVNLDVPAQIISDRTLVPVRAVSEAFDCEVNWDGNTKTVSIRADISMSESEKENEIYLISQMIIYNTSENKITEVKFNYDKNENEVEVKSSYNAYGYKYLYDDNGNLIFKQETVNDHNYYYYEEGRLIRAEWPSDSDWCEYTYDENGYLIYQKNRRQRWGKCTYDNNGNLIYFEDSDGFWYRYTYDERNNLICRESSRNESWNYSYDEYDNLIYMNIHYTHGDRWCKYSYDNSGNLIYMENDSGNWCRFSYDDAGNLTECEESYGYKLEISYEKE